jgi:ferredoxin
MGYAGINLIVGPLALRAVTLYLEDEGWEAVPIQNMVIDAGVDITTGEPKAHRKRVSPQLPAPDVMPHFRIAAVAAGLGEIGYSKLFLSPQFGPRQRLAMLLTDAPLEPDPIFEGQICDRCLLCVKDCSGQAISATEKLEVSVAGRTFEFGKLDEWRCALAYTGGAPETSPFVPDGWDFEEQVQRRWEAFNDIPYNRASVSIFHHLGAIEGARGCIRACMIHLEETGRIQARFRNPFRRRPMWRLA